MSQPGDMRIIVNGQQAFGRAVLEALLERGENVVAVYTAPDGDGPPDPLKAAAAERGLPVLQPRSFRRESVRERMREFAPDLCVMAYVTLFVPEATLNVPTRGTIQYHPSLLPLHKGPSAINWPIIFGETVTGLSIFWPDDGLDTGPILLQKEVPIGADDTVGSIYFDHLFPLGVTAMLEAVDQVRAGTAPKIAQDPNAGSYESWCRADDAEIDWKRPTQDVYNLIRGANPQPGAWTTLGEDRLQLFDCRPSDAGGDPGAIVATGAASFTVATADGGIEVLRVRPAGAGKMPAGEFLSASGLAVGQRFA